MRPIFTFFSFLSLSLLVGQTPCVDGMAGDYPCERVDLMSFVPASVYTESTGLNDVWGWVDPEDNREYAIVGTWDATVFVDITDPVNTVFVGSLPMSEEASNDNTWRDIKVYNDFAYIVADNVGDHGMQVFDLNKLRDVVNPPVTFEQDAHYGGVGSAHNVVINESQPYAYIVGSDEADGGPVFINISNPMSPTLEGSFSELGYSHDAQVLTYSGPDSEHTGKEIYFGFHGSSGEGFVIVDVSDKSDPEIISTAGYDCHEYTHQGWLTPDQRYCLINDEIDEGTYEYNTRTRIFNIEDLDNPVLVGQHISDVMSTDHNLYTRGDYAYMSNYSSGLRVVDFSRLDEGIIEEVAFFDVHPSDNNSGYMGTWSNYPYFPSGNIVVTHRTDGLFIVKLQDMTGVVPTQEFDTNLCPAEVSVSEYESAELNLSPNPASDILTIRSDELMIEEVLVLDAAGRNVLQIRDTPELLKQLDISPLDQGVYHVIVNGTYRAGQVVKVD